MKYAASILVALLALSVALSLRAEQAEQRDRVEIADPPPIGWQAVEVSGKLGSGTDFRMSLATGEDSRLALFDIQLGAYSVEVPEDCWPPLGIFLNSIDTRGGSLGGVDNLWISIPSDLGDGVDEVGSIVFFIRGTELFSATVEFENPDLLKGRSRNACIFEP